MSWQPDTPALRIAGQFAQSCALAVGADGVLLVDASGAALAWVEAVTRISGDAVSDELFAEIRRHFDEKSLVDLTLAIIAING